MALRLTARPRVGFNHDNVSMAEPLHSVLFLCTGNYYRSRFAQAVFNDLAAKRKLPWRAFSRGLWLQPGINPGKLSIYTQRELEKRKLPLSLAGEEPLPLTREDLERADRVIALKEEEHRPMMRRKFPDCEDTVTYWSVHDLDCSTPEEALPEILERVKCLLDDLAANS